MSEEENKEPNKAVDYKYLLDGRDMHHMHTGSYDYRDPISLAQYRHSQDVLRCIKSHHSDWIRQSRAHNFLLLAIVFSLISIAWSLPQ